MSTTARIYFVEDREDPDRWPLESRVDMAKHQVPVVLFCNADGYPRDDHGNGMLVALEAFLDDVPRRMMDFECYFQSAAETAGQFVVWYWEQSVEERGKMVEGGHLPPMSNCGPSLGLTVIPTIPTAGAIVFYEYLVVVHCREKRKPTVLVRVALEGARGVLRMAGQGERTRWRMTATPKTQQRASARSGKAGMGVATVTTRAAASRPKASR